MKKSINWTNQLVKNQICIIKTLQRNNGWTDGYDSKKNASYFEVEGCINLKKAKSEIKIIIWMYNYKIL